MRRSSTLALVALLVLLAGCAAPGGGDGDDDGNDPSSAPPAEEPAATPDDADDDDGGGGGGGASGDLDEIVARLEPPNATEVSRTTAGGVVFVIWESTDSTDSLTGFYEDAIADLGFEVISTTNAGDVSSWIFGNDASTSEFGGVVGIAPSTSGGPGSTVSVQVGTGE